MTDQGPRTRRSRKPTTSLSPPPHQPGGQQQPGQRGGGFRDGGLVASVNLFVLRKEDGNHGFHRRKQRERRSAMNIEHPTSKVE
jgi:hypothetical protein